MAAIAVAALSTPAALARATTLTGTAALTGTSVWQLQSCGATFCPPLTGYIETKGTFTGTLGTGSYRGRFQDYGAKGPCALAPVCRSVSGWFEFKTPTCLFTGHLLVGSVGFQDIASSTMKLYTVSGPVEYTAPRGCAAGTVQITYSAAYNHSYINGVPTVTFTDTGTLTL